MKVVVLVAVAVVAAGLGIVVTIGADGQAPLLPAAVATGLCLSSTVATLVLADAVAQSAPEFGPVAVLLGTSVRMAVAVVGVALLGEVLARSGTPRDRFAGWVAYLYIVTLVAECGLLIVGSRVDSKAAP